MNVSDDATCKFILGCFSSVIVGGMAVHGVMYAMRYYDDWITGCKRRHHAWRRQQVGAKTPREMNAGKNGKNVKTVGRANGEGDVTTIISPPVTARVWVSEPVKTGHWWTAHGLDLDRFGRSK